MSKPDLDTHQFMQTSGQGDVIYTLRTTHQNQTQLLILADQKANVLIGALVVALTILLTRSQISVALNGPMIVPLFMFVALELCAFVLALLVITPKTTGTIKCKSLQDMPNPLFFGFFTQFSQDQYVDYLTSQLPDNDAARRMLASDLYQIGRVLRRKYIILKYAYLTAALGVILPLMAAAIIFYQ